MTLEERAAKIADKIYEHRELGKDHKHCARSEAVALFAAELRAVQREAYERAAQMVEKRSGIPEHHRDIAALIRKLAGEL